MTKGKNRNKHHRSTKQNKQTDVDNSPDYESECEQCGATPVVRETGMCGPCTFGEADTIDGNW